MTKQKAYTQSKKLVSRALVTSIELALEPNPFKKNENKPVTMSINGIKPVTKSNRQLIFTSDIKQKKDDKIEEIKEMVTN
jgi:hypothetical protein